MHTSSCKLGRQTLPNQIVTLALLHTHRLEMSLLTWALYPIKLLTGSHTNIPGFYPRSVKAPPSAFVSKISGMTTNSAFDTYLSAPRLLAYITRMQAQAAQVQMMAEQSHSMMLYQCPVDSSRGLTIFHGCLHHSKLPRVWCALKSTTLGTKLK